MSGIRVKVDGLPRLRKALLQVTGEGHKAAAREVKRAALNIQAGAKERAPVDTGRLRNSITHEVSENGLSATVGTNVEYSTHVEFGTSRASAQPYLVPAFEEERGQFEARLRKALRGLAR